MPDNGTGIGESSTSSSARVGDAAARVKRDVGELGSAIAAKRDDIMESARDFVQTKPLAAVGIAFGIGYALGGGIFSRATGRIVSVGMRLGAMALVRQLLGQLGYETPAAQV